jgi:hypothetical protein
MFTSIMLIIWWLLWCYGLIISQAPHLKDEFDKVIPYQWFVGIILLILGLIDLMYIGSTISLLKWSLFFWILALAGLATKFILWFVLSRGLVTKYILTQKSDAKEKTQNVYNMLVMIQVPFGIIAIIIGIIGIVFNIMY